MKMMLKFVVVLLVVLALSGVYAAKNRGSKGRGNKNGAGSVRGLPPNAQLLATWMRTLSTATAQEMGYTINNEVYIMSKDARSLKRDDYKASKTLFDFTGGSAVVVMKVKKVKGCILLNKPTSLTKQAVSAQITALNGTTVAASVPVPLYTTNLDQAQTTNLASRPAVTALCGRKPIRGVTSTAPASSEGSTVSLTTTLGEQLSITSASAGGRGRGRGVRGRGAGRRPVRGGRPNNSPGA